MLRTLAAAYAQTERFGEAIAILQQAANLPDPSGEFKELLDADKLDYESRRPFRDQSMRGVSLIDANSPSR